MPRMARRSARSQALSQRERNSQRRTQLTFERSGEEFENALRAQHIIVCIRCLRCTPLSEVSNNNCRHCRNPKNHDDNHLYNQENGMAFGQIPEELRGLTMIEEIMITRGHSVVSVFKIHGQKTGYPCHVMNFVQRVEQVAGRLPNDPASLTAVLLVRTNKETLPSPMLQIKKNGCSCDTASSQIWSKHA